MLLSLYKKKKKKLEWKQLNLVVCSSYVTYLRKKQDISGVFSSG